MMGFLILVWGLLLAWSLVNKIWIVGWYIPDGPPFWTTLIGGALIIGAVYIWPWLSGMGRAQAPAGAGGAAAGQSPIATFFQWLWTTFVVTPLLFFSLMLTTWIVSPAFYNWLYQYETVILVGMLLAALVFFLLPPRDPEFLKKIVAGNLIVVIAIAIIYFLVQYFSGARYYRGMMKNGAIYLRPFDLDVKPEDWVRIKVLGGEVSFPKTAISGQATPGDRIVLGVEGDNISTRPPSRGVKVPPRPTGELLVYYNNRKNYLPIGQNRLGEFWITEGNMVEFRFNVSSNVQYHKDTKGKIWVVIYINPFKTPGGWIETAIKTKKYQIGAVGLVASLVVLLGLVWWKIPTTAGKQVASILILIVFGILGGKAWQAADRQWKEDYKKAAQQQAQAAKKKDPFLAGENARPGGDPSMPPESTYDRAERTITVGSDLFVLMLVAGVAGGVYVGARKLFL